jgi:hypothetical protein
MWPKSVSMLVAVSVLLVASCIISAEAIAGENPEPLKSALIYSAILTPSLCQLLPSNLARWSWLPTIGILAIAILPGIAAHANAFNAWLAFVALAILLATYAVLVHRVAFWEQQFVRALTFVSRSNIAVADAVERERLKRCEGIVGLCNRLNQPLSVLHISWMRPASEEEKANEWSFASQFERLTLRENVLQRVGSAIRNSDIVLSDGTQNGLFVICPATYEPGAEILSRRLEALLQREFAALIRQSIVTSDDHGFVLADLMIAARASKAAHRPVEHGAVVSLR